MSERRSAFVAEQGRPPTEAEEVDLAQLSQQDRREAEAQRIELEIKRAFLATPDGTPERWEAEKDELLKADRATRTTSMREASRRSQAALYDHF
jgi:hypothetical protein